MFALTKNTARQREIAEVVFRNGWDYMRGLLTRGQAEEPRLPSPDILRRILLELGPVYVKLGQLLSTRPDVLPERYIDALTDLQARVPPVAWSAIEGLIIQELNNPISTVFSSIETQAVAAGSIGQVHRATLNDGRVVALKVQRPGIKQIVDRDIALIISVAELVALTEFGKDFDIVALAKEFTKAIVAELDFNQEADYTEQLHRNLAQSNWFEPQKLVVPQVYRELTTSKLLVLEWLEGVPILEAQLPEIDRAAKREEVTNLLFRAFFQQLYIDGFFHADPHPGNIFYLEDGRVALLDCGTIGRLDPRTQQILTELLLAIVDLDAKRCSQLTLDLAEGSQSVNLDRLTNDYDRMLRKYYNRSLSQINFSQVIYEILQVARQNKIKIPSNMGLYVKTMANLEGVARSFNPEFNLLDRIKPLMVDLFRRQLLGNRPLETALRFSLDVKSLFLRSPRLLELFVDRITSETLKWNVEIRKLDLLALSIEDSANRLSFSILVGSLIMGAAIIVTGSSTTEVSIVSNILFAAASLLGLWLIFSILRSGRLK
jgi:predicted unusual protein kinase regulating ubiquinone biosynthesis (AarF/ABC1/UbiB family)